VDTLVSACPWSERPLAEAGDRRAIDVVDIHELLAESLGIEVGGRRGGMSAVATPGALDDRVLEELLGVLGSDHLFTSKPARLHRARVPAPFPVHKWADHMPDAVVLPADTEQVAEVVRIANRYRIPVVPRAGGTGLTDGAVPLRHGILLDLKRLDQIHEIDLENRTCTVGAGSQRLKLNEILASTG
jgi:hypothetical protein